MLTDDEKQALYNGLSLLEINLEPEQKQKIALYLFELLKWNRVYNLTGFKTFQDNLVKNILDSLSVAPYIKGRRLLDVGTGAGFPGFLLAIAKPEQNWVLLDANGKKTRFLEQMKHKLQQENVEVVQARVEAFNDTGDFEGICSRAFDKIPDTLLLCKHLLKENTRFYAMKGRLLDEDLTNIPGWAKVESIMEIKVPLLDEQRHLVQCICARGKQ